MRAAVEIAQADALAEVDDAGRRCFARRLVHVETALQLDDLRLERGLIGAGGEIVGARAWVGVVGKCVTEPFRELRPARPS